MARGALRTDFREERAESLVVRRVASSPRLLPLRGAGVNAMELDQKLWLLLEPKRQRMGGLRGPRMPEPDGRLARTKDAGAGISTHSLKSQRDPRS